jgi:hypothetical protein
MGGQRSGRNRGGNANERATGEDLGEEGSIGGSRLSASAER